MNVEIGDTTRNQAELRNIKYLTPSMTQRDIVEMSEVIGIKDEWGEVGNELDNILPIYQLTFFCDHLLSSMQFSCTHRKDVDELE